MDSVMRHPSLRGLRRFLLGTRDAHSLYTRYGFRPLADSTRFLEIHNPNIYHEAKHSDVNAS